MLKRAASTSAFVLDRSLEAAAETLADRPARPTLAVMKIFTERDHSDAEMPSRGRARIAGSAIAPVRSCADRYWRSGRPPYY